MRMPSSESPSRKRAEIDLGKMPHFSPFGVMAAHLMGFALAAKGDNSTYKGWKELLQELKREGDIRRIAERQKKVQTSRSEEETLQDEERKRLEEQRRDWQIAMKQVEKEREAVGREQRLVKVA